MAKKLEDLVHGAKRSYKDVQIVLDGTLGAQREKLKNAVAETQRAKSNRLTGAAPAAAQKAAQQALEAFDAEHADEIATVRVYSCAGATEWISIRLANPANPGDDKRFQALGYHPYNAAIEVIIRHATQVLDADEEHKPSGEFWKLYFEELVQPGDMEALASAVMEVNGVPTGQAFADRKKA